MAAREWNDRLQKMLGIDSNALNVGIFRARGQIASCGVAGGSGIVEVRRGQRRIGLTTEQIDIAST